MSGAQGPGLGAVAGLQVLGCSAWWRKGLHHGCVNGGHWDGTSVLARPGAAPAPRLSQAAAVALPCRWDAGQDSIIRYQFKDSPDLGLLPPGAQLSSQAEEEGSEGDDSSEWETMGSDEEWSEEEE